LIKRISSPGKITARYGKVSEKKLGVLTTWHLGYSQDDRSWLYIDEIEIK